MFRRTLKITSSLLLVLLALGLALPIWLPWVISGLGPRLGLRVGSFDRQGYARLLLNDVHFQRDGIEASAESVSTPLWPFWVLRSAQMEPAPRPMVRIQGWRLEVISGDPQEPAGEASLSEVVEQVRALMPDLHQLLPEIQALKGTLIVGEAAYGVEKIQWKAPVLGVGLAPESGDWQVDAELSLPVSAAWHLETRVLPWNVALSADLTGPSEQIEVLVGINWEESKFSGQLNFDQVGFLPRTADVHSEMISLNAGLLGLDDYESVTGSVVGSWSMDHYSIEIDLNASPLVGGETDQPPLVAALDLAGDLDGARLDSLEILVPWATARLSEPLELQFGPGLMAQQAELEVEIDLEASPLPAKGHLTGVARVKTAYGRWPTVSAQLGVENLEVAGFEGFGAEVRARLEYPLLSLAPSTVQVDPGMILELEGQADLEKRTVTGSMTGWVGNVFLQQVLPPELSVGDVSVVARMDGPWLNPGVELQARADGVDLPGLVPVTVDLGLHGCGLDFDDISIQVSNGVHRLEISAGLNWAAERERFSIRQVELTEGDTVQLSTLSGSGLHTDLRSWIGGELALVGDEKSLSLKVDGQWPSAATWALDGHNLPGDLLSGFLEQEMDLIAVESLRTEGSWDRGPAVYTLETVGKVVTAEQVFTFRIKADGGEDSLKINEAVVAGEGGDVLSIEGQLPVVLSPAGDEVLVVGWNQSIELAAHTSPNPEFWDRMSGLLGVEVSDLLLDLRLSGPARNPVGALVFSAAKVALVQDAAATEAPSVTDIELKAEMTADRIVLQEGRFLVGGEAVDLSGELPTGSDGWLRRVLEGERPDLRQASARLRTKDARISAFALFLPTVLAPSGRLDLDLTLAPGWDVTGFLRLEDAALRPIRPFGTLQEIGAHIEFKGRNVHCGEVTAVIGGQRVSVTGDLGWDTEGEVGFDFRVQGRKVPLVRQPGLVVRSDLDLRLEGTSEESVLLSGTVGLSDSLFVADLKTLLSGSVDSPSKRPPYFSIEAQPFAGWKLDLDVVGQEFMRVETPVFKGLFSARFALTGTLAEPKALGDVKVDSGSIEFPFATLKVNSGVMSIREDNPYDILMDIEARSRIFGFDVRMLVGGYASAPRLEFESEPNLGSDAVLLMLTTGEIPDRSGYYSMQQRLTKLAIYLGRSLLMEFGLGGGSGESQFIIESGRDISQKGRETYNIEVLLTDTWSLVGGYDEFDSYNGGVKWRVYSK